MKKKIKLGNDYLGKLFRDKVMVVLVLKVLKIGYEDFFKIA